MSTTAQPSLAERVAEVADAATRTWDQVRGVTPGPEWGQADAAKRERAIETVRLAMAGAPPSQLHEAWRARKLAQGWSVGPVKDPRAKTDPMLVPYTDLSGLDARTPELVAAVTRALACGRERWDVKTLTDQAASQVNLTPLTATVGELAAFPAPFEPIGRVAQEFNTYQVTATVTMAKQEADSDIHMVLKDGNQTMIVEAACTDCAQHSVAQAQIASVRQTVETQFPTAAAGGREEVSVPVTVTGVAFFDRLHGQEGVAPNGIELHPVLSFEVTQA
jgi:hypothetical protein